MVVGNILTLLVALIILTSIFGSLHDAELANQKIHSSKIVLDGRVYDTSIEKRLNLTFVNDKDDNKQRQLYIHVHGPVSSQSKTILEDGFKSKHKMQYIPHNTFTILSSKKNSRTALESEEFRKLVKWIGVLNSNNKLDTDTKDCATSGLSVNVLLVDSKDNMKQKVHKKWQNALRQKLSLFDKEYSETIKVTRVSNNKVKVTAAKSKHCKTVLKWLSKHAVSDVIQNSENFEIASFEKMIPLEDNIQVLSDLNPLSDAYKNILIESAHHGQPIGQPSLDDVQEMWRRGLDGSGEVIGVGDTGLDYNNCAVFDNSSQVPFYHKLPKIVPDSKHRKIQSYFCYADDYDLKDGHGTHVATSLVGNVDAQNPMSAFNGIAKNAKVAFLDIGTKRRTLKIPPDLVNVYFPFMERSGAHISSNSWGSRKYGQYTITAHEVDRYSFSNKHHLALFAAGNSGRSGSKTIVSPATA
ncbi:serine protease/ABC transporter B family protein tagC [Acrasis kona]|uniref:Serine protease/ABC transporter B family protein tagC n=1 Tax=Acrasis kona TaxID=1008807 RepID=A0AAW2ZH40_9EUKA